MHGLVERDVRALGEVVERLQHVAAAHAFATTLLECVRTLIACDAVSYEEILPGRAMVRVSDPASDELAAYHEPFMAHIDQHPMIAHFRATQDPTPYRFSDFLSSRELHQLPLYRDVLRHVGVEHQAGFPAAAAEPPLIGLTVSRASGPDFSQRDLTLLRVLQPIVAIAWQRTELQAIVAAVEASEGPARRSGLVVLGEADQVRWMSPRAREILTSRYGRSGASLPRELAGFVARAHARGHPDRLTIKTGEGGRLRVRYLPATQAAPARLVIDSGGLPTSEHLQSLGLTEREAEVLMLMVRGLSNRQIAGELQVAVGTVRTHVEHVLAKLGVRSRGEAVWVVLGEDG